MYRGILILYLFISGIVKSQEVSQSIIGDWFSCDKRDFNIGDTINLQRDSCIINYEHNGMQFKIQVSLRFNENYFSLYKNSEVIAGGTYFHYWKIKEDSMILIGFDENDINEEYQILTFEPDNMTLIKRK